MTDSILTSTKKMVNVAEADTAFDVDILMYINSVFATLNQLSVGPDEGFAIQDDTAVWSDYIGTDLNLNLVQTYVYMRVRLLFDPPGTSFAIAALKEQIEQAEWRLNTYMEGVKHPWTPPVEEAEE